MLGGLRNLWRADPAIASEILGHVARIAGIGIVEVQAVGPPAELADRLQRAHQPGFEGIDGPFQFLGRGRLGLDAVELLGNGSLNLGNRVAGADRGHNGKLTGQFLAVLIGLHVLGDLLLADQCAIKP